MNKSIIVSLLLLFSTITLAQTQNNATRGYASTQQINLLAQQIKRLDRRMGRIEKLLNNKILAETVERIDDLQSEIRELRGEVEDIGYKVDSASRRNKNLYLDTDRRLQELERQRRNVYIQPQNTQPSPVETKQKTTAFATGQLSQKEKTVAQSSEKTEAVKVETTRIKKQKEKVELLKQKNENPAVVGNKQVVTLRSPALNAQERQDYLKAFNYLKHGRYKKSLKAFRQFLKKYPNGRYADNAQYWLAESNYVSRFFDKAIVEFNKVVDLYPASPKVADARLKLGYCYYEKGEWNKARQIFMQVARDYKGSSVARLAERRLKQLKRDGH